MKIMQVNSLQSIELFHRGCYRRHYSNYLYFCLPFCSVKVKGTNIYMPVYII